MLQRLKEDLKEYIDNKRLIPICEDIFCYLQKIKENSIDGFTSSWTIHNFHKDKRKELLKLIYKTMKPRGLFVNMDKYVQDDPEKEPLAIGGNLPIEKVYSFEPIPKELTNEQAKYILGAQGNVWTEYISNPMKAEYMALPRMCALAEVVWTDKDQRQFNDFMDRLEEHNKRLDLIGANYFPKSRDLLNQP